MVTIFPILYPAFCFKIKGIIIDKLGQESDGMKLTAVVKYLGSLAHYVVSRTKAGIYEARLTEYEGNKSSQPPNEILMVRSVGHWSGDIQDKDLTDKIGYSLEEECRKGDLFKKTN